VHNAFLFIDRSEHTTHEAETRVTNSHTAHTLTRTNKTAANATDLPPPYLHSHYTTRNTPWSLAPQAAAKQTAELKIVYRL
jgi:hypothetical protein